MKELEELGYSVDEVKKMHKNSNEFKSFCFQLMKEYGSKKSIVFEISNIISIPVSEIIYYAGRYKNEKHLNYMDISVAKKKNDVYLKGVYNSDNGELIKELLSIKINDVDKIVDFFTRNTKIYKGAVNYIGLITNLYYNNYHEKLREFKERLLVFKNYLEEQRRLEKSQINQVINENINDDAMVLFQNVLRDNEVKSFGNVKEKYGITEYRLNKMNKVLKNTMYDNGKSMYDMIEEKFIENKKLSLEKYDNSILKILPLINNGVPIGEKKRIFDIFDCYTYFGYNISQIIDALRYRFSAVNSLDVEKYNAVNKLKTILLRYTLKTLDYYSGSIDNANDEYKEEFIRKSLEEPLEINQKVINERLVRGSGHMVTDKEKKVVFRAMEDYHIPFNSEMYLLGMNKLNNGKMELIIPDTIDSYLENIDKKRGTR